MNYAEEFDTSLDSFRDNVPRQDCNKISKSEFVEKFEKPRIPVVLTHSMDHWKGMRKWTVEVNVPFIQMHLKGQYHGRSIGDIMIFGQNSLNLNFEHCVN